jgi:hypothetical protein
MRGGDYDVFVSYARSDGAAAAELNTWLRGQGLATFFDRSELSPGLPWVPALEEAINRSRAVAILFGKHGIGNTQQYERQFALVRQAHEAAFPVIPVLMPGCESPPTGFLQLLTWVDLSKAASVLQQPDSLASLRAALSGEAIAASTIRAQVCPYRGLEPFREEDASFFCGRDDAIRELVAKVQAHSFVAVIGASGSGKSSLVFAGLLPALRQESQTRTWDVVSLRPGKSPLGALAAAFGTAPENAGPAEIDAYLKKEAGFYRDGDADTLTRIVDRRLDGAPERPDRLLIYIDQWEELYAMAPAAEDNERLRQHTSDVDKFIGLLVATTSGPRSRATVVLTVRADFYNPLLQNPLISTLLPQQQVNIPLMKSGDLRSAIATPAKNAGLSFSPPELIDQILNDVGSEEGRLPLLQFALKETWERREENRLTAEAYTAVGGVTGAIEKTAEGVYDRLTPAQQDAARHLFLRLVTPGEGQEDTRARSLIPDDPQQRDVINFFSDPKTRLLVTSFATLEGAGQAGSDVRATVEVAHEALIQRWPTLQAWVNGNREKLRARTVILRAMAEWEENSKSDRYLLDPGVQLERGRALVDSPGDVPVDDIRAYVARSIKKEDDRLAAEREAALADQKRIADAERKAREAAEEKTFIEQAARKDAEVSASKLRMRLMAAVAAIAFAGVFGFVSYYEYKRASQQTVETQRQLDRANQALAQSINSALGLDPSTPFSPFQRNALWKLAATGEPVKRAFVSMLAASPEEMARASPGYPQIFRALGPDRPSPAEAENLVSAVLGGLKTTEGTNNVKSLVAELRVLTPKLAETHENEALDTLLLKIGQETDPTVLLKLAQAIQPLRLSDSRANEAFVPLLRRIDHETDPEGLLTLAQALQVLPGNLSDSQANDALHPLLRRIGQETDSEKLQKLRKALEVLSQKLSEAQAQQALDPALRQIGQTKDAVALQTVLALGPKLSEAHASEALALILPRFDQITEPEALETLTQAVEALPADLTEAQANEALKPILGQFGQNRGSDLQALARALQALAPELTEAQANEALEPILRQISQATDPFTVLALARALQALPARLTEAQASKALEPVLLQIGHMPDTDIFAWMSEASTRTDALAALAPKLPERQANEALLTVLEQIGKTTNFSTQVQQLGQLAPALSANFTEETAQQTLGIVLRQISQTTDDYKLEALAGAIQALAMKLTGAQVNEALVAVQRQIVQMATPAQRQNEPFKHSELVQAFGSLTETTSPHAFRALAMAFKALAPKLTEPQADEALEQMLRKFGQTENPDALQALAEALRALPARLTEAQASNALDPVLRQIGETTDPFELPRLAHALRALATKLTDEKARESLSVVASSLAWAARRDEAVDWAQALIALSTSAADRSERLATAIAYPAAAGPATEVLLEGIRAQHPDAPAKEAGTEAALAWLAAKYPVLRPPACPPPPQPYEISRLKCPPHEN